MADDRKRIAIIGAGISGLLACKYALSKGFHPTVFEAQNGVGGLWNKTLSTTKLQTPRTIFRFSDLPWPDSVTVEFPSHDQVLGYLRAYAHHFGLSKHIKFNTKVLSINYKGVSEEGMEAWSLCGGKWEVEVSTAGGSSARSEVYEADFVVLCLGKYSDVPHIPEFPPGKGPEAFQGRVIHSMEYSDLEAEEAKELVKGKKVAVVGFQKQALETAMLCSEINGAIGLLTGKENPCRVLYRTEHWNIPDFQAWSFPLAKLYFNRFAELLIHKPGEGLFLRLLATILSPIRWAISKFVESDIKHRHQLAKHGMVPKHSFLQAITTCLVSTVPEQFYDRVVDGSIVLKKAPSFSFCEEGIEVEDDENSVLETDVVILATGFNGEKKLQDIFGSESFREIIAGDPNAVVPLYRGCIPPRIPQLAVLGYSESFNNLFTSEMRSRWLAELLAGKFKLPAIREMEEDAAEWDAYLKEYGGEFCKRSSVSAIHIWHNDQLCVDMGWKPRRKNGLWAELFEPYGPMDYVSP
ncbi:unnamed protein product [Linum tenue]|uniref:Flavin-containing monooxygenase n=1 Tax=Linum tenue TaxID=586396 RepID=A0AAV0JCX6_9ROSI|nr:unnamed protein product [Linum tenue]